MSNYPTKATPAGCVLGLLGVFLLIFGFLFGWIAYNAFTADVAQSEQWWKFAIACMSCVTVGVFVVRIGLRMAIQADMCDPYSNDKPKMRF